MIIKPPTSSRPPTPSDDLQQYTASSDLVLEVKASGGIVLEVGASAGVAHDVGATAAITHDVGATAAIVLEVGASAGKILWRCDSWNFCDWRRHIAGIVSGDKQLLHRFGSSDTVS